MSFSRQHWKKKKIIKNKKKKKRGEEKTRVQQFFLCNNKALVRAKRASSLGILPYSTAVERDRESWKRGFVTLSYFSFLALQTTDHGPAYYPTWRRKLLEDTRKKSSKKLPCTLFDYPQYPIQTSGSSLYFSRINVLNARSI